MEESYRDWVVVVSDGTRFLGRAEINPGGIMDAIKGNVPLKLNPCFEYPIFAEPVQGRGFKKMPIPNGIDMMVHPCDVYVSRVSRVVFFEDMHVDDRKTVVMMVQLVEGMLQKQRAEMAGITIPSGGRVQ